MSETREYLKTLRKDQLLGLIHARGIRGHSGKNKDGLVELILNPASAAMKSPGRPPGSGTKAKAEAAPKKPRAPTKSEKTIEYSQDGLNGTTSDVLKSLAKLQGITAMSNKKKADIIAALLAKPLVNTVMISVTSKSGSQTNVTVLASGVRAAQGAVAVSSVAAPAPVTYQPPIPQPALPVMPQMSPRSLAMPTYIPAPAFRQ